MTDWREAGRRADAHYVRDLYRRSFSSPSKAIARERTFAAMRAAGVTTVLDLWGGGKSAEALVAAGFRVISVEDGSMELVDKSGRKVSQERKRRALEYAGAEGGYEVRFGKAERFAHEADGAFLDFCGPWTQHTRRTIAACRHMTCVVVTLTPDHDVSSDATSMHERQMAYQLFLKMAWSDKPRWEFMQGGGGVRRLLDYRRTGGFAVFLYLLSRHPVKIPALLHSQRAKTSPEIRARQLASKRAHYHRLPLEIRRAKWHGKGKENERIKYRTDPEYRARYLLRSRHRGHLPGVILRLPCELCGRLGAASPA